MIKIIAGTDVGQRRENNEDAYAYRVIGENCGYAIVCDGMGGEKAGDVASTTACQILSKFFDRDLNEEVSEAATKAILFSAISAANAKVFSMSRENLQYNGMGTTLIVVVVVGRQMHVVNIGDSRIYLCKDRQVSQITRDHTVVQNLIDRGEISQEEALTHPQRHFITRALGVNNTLDIDYQMYDLEEGDMVLLCSDGLHSYLKTQELPELLRPCVREGSVQRLIDYANSHGGSDNITAVILVRS